MRGLLAFTLVILGSPLVAQAQNGKVHRFWQDVHRNNCWPVPFQQPDREAVRSPFDVMANKGWQLQNTLGNHHFESGSQELTRAGKLKVRSILANSPESRRMLFVLQGASGEETAIRLDAVQAELQLVVGPGPMPEVAQTQVPPPGWPAEYIDDIGRKMQALRPDPILPAMQSTSGGN